VMLESGETVLLQRVTDISPANPFSEDVSLSEGVDAATLKVSVLAADGRELVSYAPRSYPVQEMPKPVLPPPAPQDIKTNEELYLTGLRLEQFYNPTVDPRPYYEEALKRDPDDARVNTALAIADCKRLDFAAAEERLRRAVARLTHDYTRPRDGEALYYLGAALAAQGKGEEARDNFNRAAWSLAWHTAAEYALAELDCRNGDFGSALGHLDNALATNARDTRGMSLRSAVLRKLDRNGEASEQARDALAIDPLDCFAGNEEYLAGAKKSPDALHALTVRMRGEVHTHLELASDYMAAGMWDEAIGVLKRLDTSAVAAGSTYPMLYYYLAYCFEQIGDKEAAATYDRLAASMPPDYCFPYGFESMRVLERAMEANPADGRAAYYLGNLLYDLQPDKAVASWEKARALSPDLATLHRNLGYAYARNEEVDRAIASYEASVQCSATDPRVLYELELIYEKAGADPQKRLAVLNTNPETVLKRDDLIARKIQLLVQTSQYDEAISMLTGRTYDTWEGGGGIHNVYVNAYTLRGLAAMGRGDAQSAQGDFTAALDYPANLGVDRPLQDPPVARTEYLLGLACEAAGNADAAKEHFQKAAGSDVQATEFRYHKARALQKLGSSAEAEPLFDALIADGTKQLDEGAKVDFFAAFGEKVSHDKTMAQAHYLLALGYLGKGESEKAAEAFQEALKADPNHLWARADSQGQ
ncbi:MAG: tetratricopeptide repeat protein, partial [Candidatus Hydrogenedentes bacterium]|nr:tetratricopeptide repeat protein [Candidatus Hydrogenedentota bacterium]